MQPVAQPTIGGDDFPSDSGSGGGSESPSPGGGDKGDDYGYSATPTFSSSGTDGCFTWDTSQSFSGGLYTASGGGKVLTKTSNNEYIYIVRTKTPIPAYGSYYWEVSLDNLVLTSDVHLGVAQVDYRYDAAWLKETGTYYVDLQTGKGMAGSDNRFSATPWSNGDRIGFLLDYDSATLDVYETRRYSTRRLIGTFDNIRSSVYPVVCARRLMNQFTMEEDKKSISSLLEEKAMYARLVKPEYCWDVTQSFTEGLYAASNFGKTVTKASSDDLIYIVRTKSPLPAYGSYYWEVTVDKLVATSDVHLGVASVDYPFSAAWLKQTGTYYIDLVTGKGMEGGLDDARFSTSPYVTGDTLMFFLNMGTRTLDVYEKRASGQERTWVGCFESIRGSVYPVVCSRRLTNQFTLTGDDDMTVRLLEEKTSLARLAKPTYCWDASQTFSNGLYTVSNGGATIRKTDNNEYVYIARTRSPFIASTFGTYYWEVTLDSVVLTSDCQLGAATVNYVWGDAWLKKPNGFYMDLQTGQGIGGGEVKFTASPWRSGDVLGFLVNFSTKSLDVFEKRAYGERKMIGTFEGIGSSLYPCVASRRLGNQFTISTDDGVRDMLVKERSRMAMTLAPTTGGRGDPFVWDTATDRRSTKISISSDGKTARGAVGETGIVGIVFAKHIFRTGRHSWEVRVDGETSAIQYTHIGVCYCHAEGISPLRHTSTNNDSQGQYAFHYEFDGDVRGPTGERHFGPAIRPGDRVGVTVDCDRGEVSFSINGTVVTGAPAFRFTTPVVYPLTPFCVIGSPNVTVTLTGQWSDNGRTGAATAASDLTGLLSALSTLRLDNYVWDTASDRRSDKISISTDGKTARGAVGTTGIVGIVFARHQFRTGRHTWEVRVDGSDINYTHIGVCYCHSEGISPLRHTSTNNDIQGAQAFHYEFDGDVRGPSGERHFGPAIRSGDRVGVIVDCDRGEVSFSINGTIVTGAPAFRFTTPVYNNMTPFCVIGSPNVAVTLISSTPSTTPSPLASALLSSLVSRTGGTGTDPYIWDTASDRRTEKISISTDGKTARGAIGTTGIVGIVFAKQIFTSGKHSWEVRVDGDNIQYTHIGVCYCHADGISPLKHTSTNNDIQGLNAFHYEFDGDVRGPIGERHFGPAIRSGDRIGVHVDCDRGEVSFSVNGVIVNGVVAFRFSTPTPHPMTPFCVLGSPSVSVTLLATSSALTPYSTLSSPSSYISSPSSPVKVVRDYFAWDPSPTFTGGLYTSSNSGQTIRKTDKDGYIYIVRTKAPIPAYGSYYWEVLLDNMILTSDCHLGVAPSDYAFSNAWLKGTGTFYMDLQTGYGMEGSTTRWTGIRWRNGDTLGFLLNYNAGTLDVFEKRGSLGEKKLVGTFRGVRSSVYPCVCARGVGSQFTIYEEKSVPAVTSYPSTYTTPTSGYTPTYTTTPTLYSHTPSSSDDTILAALERKRVAEATKAAAKPKMVVSTSRTTSPMGGTKKTTVVMSTQGGGLTSLFKGFGKKS